MSTGAHPRSSAGGADDLWATLGLCALGLAIGFSGGVWATGQLAGRLLGNGPPSAGLAESGRVLVRLPRHIGDPASAWPAADRPHLPGATAIYASFAAIVAAVVLSTLLALRIRHRLGGRTAARGDTSGAEWARPADLTSLLVSRPRPGRLTLGRFGRRLLAAEERASVLVLAPTGSFKTTGLAVPALLEWPGPAIALSVKRDLLDGTVAYRRHLDGEVMVYDPAELTGVSEVVHWTPLTDCDTWAGARQAAHELALARRPMGGRGGSEDNAFWYAQAAKLLAPMLFAAGSTGLAIDTVVAWVDRHEEDQVGDILHALGNPSAEDAWVASMTRDGRHLSSVYATAEDVLEAYADPGVQSAAMGTPVTAERLLSRTASTLYVCAPVDEQERLRPVFVMLVRTLLKEVYRRHEEGQPLDRPLLVVLDEAANVAPLPDLARLASTGRAVGIQLVTVFQDLGQLEALYGERGAGTILNNHAAKLVLSGTACERTLRYAERLLGDEATQETSYTLPSGGGRSEQRSVRYRPMGRAEVVRGMPAGHGVLVYGRLPAAQIAMRPWFRDRRLRRVVGGTRAAG